MPKSSDPHRARDRDRRFHSEKPAERGQRVSSAHAFRQTGIVVFLNAMPKAKPSKAVRRVVLAVLAEAELCGSVVTWGYDASADSSAVAAELASGVTAIYSTGSAFATELRATTRN